MHVGPPAFRLAPQPPPKPPAPLPPATDTSPNGNPVRKQNFTTDADKYPMIFLVGERLATIKMTLSKYDLCARRTCPMLNFQRRQTSPDACAMLQAIRLDQPTLVWIQWSHLLQEPGRRPHVRTALEFFAGMVEEQLKQGGDVVLEAKACDVPVRDELFAGSKRIGGLLGHPSRVHWCALDIKGGKDDKTVICGEHLVMSNKPWPDMPCVCQRQSSSYVANEGLAYEQFVEKIMIHFNIISFDDVKPPSIEWHRTQRQLRDKTGARDYVKQNRKSVTFTGADVQTYHVDASSSQPRERVAPPAMETLLAAETPLNNKVDQATSTNDLCPPSQTAYPTDSHVRAKSKRAQLERDKTPEEVKAMRKKKPMAQEQHFDDCGSDTEPLMDHEARTALAMSDPCGAAFWFDECDDSVEEDFDAYLADPHFFLSYLLGSDVEETSFWDRYSPSSARVEFDQLTAFLSKEERCGVDLLEIYGGEAGVTKLAIRRRLRTGANMDIVSGVDLTKQEHARRLLEYIDVHKPFVVVMGPPCTTFSSWSHFNRVMNPSDFQVKRVIGEKLANLSALVARRQLEAGRHFLLENPRGSELFKLPSMVKLRRDYDVADVTFPQCAVGLKSPDGQPILKWTTLWASNHALISDFENLTCDHKHHWQLTGKIGTMSRTQQAQVWPPRMCENIVNGIVKTLRHDRENAYPVFRKWPEGTVFDCDGCKGHRAWHHPAHTRRSEPPGLCRYYDRPTDGIKCPACLAGKGSLDPGHTEVAGECAAPEFRHRNGLPRKSGPVRDPGRRAVGGAERRKRMIDDEQLDDPGPLGELLAGPPGPVGVGSDGEDGHPNPSGASSSSAGPLLAPAGEPPNDAPEQPPQVGPPSAKEEELMPGELGEPLAPKIRKIRADAGVERPGKADAETQEGVGGKEDWRTDDVSRVMARLKSDDEELRKLAIQRLHIRWYHLAPTHMQALLRAAGAPARAVGEVPGVVQGCDVCRNWQIPTTASVTATRLITEFNYEVQMDLWFLHSLIDKPQIQRTIMHLIDACVRWSANGLLKDKEEITLCTRISELWLTVHGPMRTLVQDGESGMKGRAVADWAEANRIQLKYRPPGSKAWIAERHQQIQRKTFHSIEGQMQKEGIYAPVEQTLATVTFAHNALVNTDGSVAYQALYGRTPALLPTFDGATEAERDDRLPRGETLARSQARIREIAVTKIVEHTAKDRLRRADHHRTRPALELAKLKVGQQVDIWFEPSSKDVSGWRGPAVIKTIQHDENAVTVRYQGRTLDRRGQEVREHVAYLIFLVSQKQHPHAQWNILRDACENLSLKKVVVYGLVYHGDTRNPGWHLTKASQTKSGHRVLEAGLFVASTVARIEECTTVRLSRGVSSLQPLLNFSYSELWIWHSTLQGGDEDSPPMVFDSADGDLDKSIDIKNLVSHDSAIHSGEASWKDYCVVQFLGAKSEDTEDLIRRYPGIRLMAGNGQVSRKDRPPVPPTPTPPSGSLGPTPRASTPTPRASTPTPRASTPTPRASTPTPRPSTPAPKVPAPAPIGPLFTPPPPPPRFDASRSRSRPTDAQDESPILDVVIKTPAPPPTPPESGAGRNKSTPAVVPSTRSRTPVSQQSSLDGILATPPPPPAPPGGGGGRVRQSMTRSRSTPGGSEPKHMSPDMQFPPTPPPPPAPPAAGKVAMTRSRSPWTTASSPISGALRTPPPPPAPPAPPAASKVAATPRSRSPWLPSPPTPMETVLQGGGTPPPPPQPPGQTVPTPRSRSPPGPKATPIAGTPTAAVPRVPLPWPAMGSQVNVWDLVRAPRRKEIHTPPQQKAAPEKRSRFAQDTTTSNAGSAALGAGTQGEGIEMSAPPVAPTAAVSPAATQYYPSPTSAAASTIPYVATPPSAAHSDRAAAAEQSQQHQPLLPTAENAALQPDPAQEEVREEEGEDDDHDEQDMKTWLVEINEADSDEGDLLPDETYEEDCGAGGDSFLAADEPPSTISKALTDLSTQDMANHAIDIIKAKKQELTSLHELGCFRRLRRSSAKNVVDTRWVLKWKHKDNKHFIKARLTMRGFKDHDDNLATFAGTATRWGQRVVNAITAQQSDWVLFSFDVSAAFAKGLSFKELSELTGEPLRVVQFELHPDDIKLLREISGYSDFNPRTEVIEMVKAVYGLKDAPRAWRKKLHLILEEFGLKSLYADPQLYVLHDTRVKLNMILSAHVDDLKGGAPKTVAMELLKHLEKHVGTCTQEWANFTHVGIEHVTRANGIYTHQEKYVASLREIDKKFYADLHDEQHVSDQAKSHYSTLLGGVAWLCLTMPAIAVYVQALQRHGAEPRAQDLKRLNLVLRWVRRHKIGILFRKLPGRLRLVGVTDAAFKAIPDESSGLALRGCVIVLNTDCDTTPASPDGACNILEFQCRRQRRVVRSTFSGELNGLVDTLEVLLVIQICLHQIYHGCEATAKSLADDLDNGRLQPPADAAVDARSVFDCLAATDIGELVEGSLKLHVLSLRERLQSGTLRRLFWTDTRDMLADGLTKGTVPRDQLISVSNRGEYRTAHATASTTFVNGRRQTTGSTVVRNA